MGYSLVKYLDSASYKRALFYLDRGESDLPRIDPNTFTTGSRAISQSTGQEWFLDTNLEWRPVRNAPGSKTYERNKYGGNEFEILPVVREVRVTPTKLTMNKNSSAQLFAEVLGDDILEKRIRWEVLSSLKNGTYITQDGYFHVGDYNKATVLTVRATSLIDDACYKDISVQVDPYGELIGEVYSISIAPSQPILGRGQTLQLDGTVIGNGSYSDEVIWSISANSSSSIDEDGKLTIGEDETYPVIIVTAKSAFNEAVTASMPVIVKAIDKAPTITKVEIVPKTLTIGPSCFASLAAVVDGSGEYISDVKWTVEATSPDTVITRNGMLAIGDTEVEGDILVRATSVLDETKYDEITVVISKSVTPATKRTLGVIVEPNALSVYKSYNAIFFAKVVGINIYDQRVTWTVERNSSEYTKIKPTGSFTVASEEDASSVIIKAAAVSDSTVFGLAAVEILNGAPSSGGDTPTPATNCVADISIDAQKNLVVTYRDGTQKIAGKVSSGVYTPHITSEDKILSFTFDAEPGEVPAPVDLNVDLSDYALKSELLIGADVTADENIGGIPAGTSYPADAAVRDIMKDMFEPLPQGDLLLYKGATTDIPTDLSGLTKIPGKSKEELLRDKLNIVIEAQIDPTTGRGQYPVLALDKRLALDKWLPPGMPEDWPSYSFDSIDKGDYTLYHLTSRIPTDADYLFTFKEG